MSYILDALRKSDAQRRRGAPPALLAPQVAAAAPARQRTLAYGLLAAALVGAGIVVGALRPWQAEPPAAATPALAERALEASSKAPAPLPAQVEAVRVPERVAPAQQAAPRRQAVSRAPAAAVARERAKPVAAGKNGVRPGDAAPVEKVVAFAELPVPVQQEMPNLSVSVHAYSPVAKDRLVGINDRVLHEGESVAPGLTLEQITPEGMILSYKGYRFRRGVR